MISAIDLSSYLGLRTKPVDYFDGEKVYIEFLAILMLAAIAPRVRYRWVRHVTGVAARSGGEKALG